MNTSRSEIVPDNPSSPSSDPSFFYNRELSWLDFNRRVLEEAIDDRNPLLEKCKFAAIYASNLDEFFMIRVSRLFDHVAAGFNLPDNKSGMKRKSTANTSFVNKPINNQKVLKAKDWKNFNY